MILIKGKFQKDEKHYKVQFSDKINKCIYCFLSYFQLNFIGVTVEPERKYIHFPSNKHMFTPVAVGEKVSPKQVYELYNGGATSVKFNFDLAPLELLRQVKYTLVSKMKSIRNYQLQIQMYFNFQRKLYHY